MKEKQEYLKGCIQNRKISYNYHDACVSKIEAVLARGDRRLSRVLVLAAEEGRTLDAWDEYFSYNIWLDAFTACGVDPDFYTVRGFEEDEILPWDMIDVGVNKAFLHKERERYVP